MFAIIVGTHGKLAEELVETAKMIGGEAPNLRAVTLLPGEGPDDVIAKYRKALEELDTSGGVIFLNDLFGGSPYNAAIRIIPENDTYVAVTGVNLPMLLELITTQAFMPDTTLEEALEKAFKSGKTGVQVFPEEKSPVAKKKASAAKTAGGAKSASPASTDGKLMDIAFCRIDDRLIHGQVKTVWTKVTNCNRIMCVSDDVAQDTMRKQLLLQVAPPGIKAYVVPVDTAVKAYKDPKYGLFNTFFLFTNPTDVLRAIEGGIPFKSVNLGGMTYKDGTTLISQAVAVSKKDAESLVKIHEKGVEVEIRMLASDVKGDMMAALKAKGLA
ncbi:PTS mannose transporter subunit IIAB [Selenomonas sp. TAMA-11512]|uniref:mannose/fructose/sorbose PTS transporter subunit IIA n=1 Tax=Selenomonas sp. TAMA-11512 TaxID=3095337 RepID=UPI00308C1699|nr:PTS mannose transporter subunit IIAB [Selenomonas sp. TAMA-11512]